MLMVSESYITYGWNVHVSIYFWPRSVLYVIHTKCFRGKVESTKPNITASCFFFKKFMCSYRRGPTLHWRCIQWHQPLSFAGPETSRRTSTSRTSGRSAAHRMGDCFYYSPTFYFAHFGEKVKKWVQSSRGEEQESFFTASSGEKASHWKHSEQTLGLWMLRSFRFNLVSPWVCSVRGITSHPILNMLEWQVCRDQ